MNKISKEEEYELIRLAQNGDTLARNKLIEQYYYTIRKIAGAAEKSNVFSNDIDDLTQIGVLIVINNIKKFDFSKKCRFITFIYTCLQNKLYLASGDLTKISSSSTSKHKALRKMKSITFEKTVEDKNRLEEKEEFDKANGMLKSIFPQHYDKIIKRHVEGRTLKSVGGDYNVSQESIRQDINRSIEFVVNHYDKISSNNRPKKSQTRTSFV